MKLPKTSTLLRLLLTFLIILLIENSLVYIIAKSTCLEEKEVPIRWESGGLFGVLTAIPTTQEKADEIGKICIRKIGRAHV